MSALIDDGLDLASIDVVGHRVVHGGERFLDPAVIDDQVLADLDALAELAPSHNPVATDTIRAARRRLPRAPHVAAFDTAFHATLPDARRRYPVPAGWEREHGIRRYGFHGLSVAWCVRRAGELLDRPPEALGLVVAHLGGGCSVSAVEGARSVATSMGMTPLEGLMMATRAGSIDPGIIFRLLRHGLTPSDIERQLDRAAGLLGVGGTPDMRELLARAATGEARAELAIEMFVDRAAAGIAAITTALPRLDALVFSGGIGSGSAEVRSRICERLVALRVPCPSAEGPQAPGSTDAVIARGDGISVLRIESREDVVIAEGALRIIGR